MRVKFLFLLIFISVFTCKAAKERKKCFELLENNTPLNISNFEEFIEYIGEEKEKTIDVWMIDVELKTKIEFKNFVNSRDFKILKIYLLPDLSGKVLHPSKDIKAVLILTNKCLKKNNYQ